MFSTTAIAQEQTVDVTDYTVINYGDGRLLFRTNNEAKALIQGEHRLIDGYSSEYILANLKDGMLHGKYEYYKQNKLTEKSIYKEGRLDSIRHTYSRSGNLEEEATYKDGVLNGIRTRYHYDGKTIMSIVAFVDGKANGSSQTFSQNGKIETEKGFKLGVEDGPDRRYDSETGEVTMDTYYKDGKPHGKWVEHTSGNIGDVTRISNFENGVAIGEYIETIDHNGSIRIKGSYKDGKKDGLWIDNRSKGSKRSTKYANGEKVEENYYFINGTISKSVSVSDGRKNGVTKEYHLNGNLKSEFNYANGLEEGTYKRFYEDGTLREEGLCEDDSAIFRKEYHTNGKLKSVAKRENGAWETVE